MLGSVGDRRLGGRTAAIVVFRGEMAKLDLQQRVEEQLHQFGTCHHGSFCSASSCPQKLLKQPDISLLWRGMLLIFAP